MQNGRENGIIYTKVACGTVINQKFSPAMFTDDANRAKLLTLLKVYFSKGGQALHIIGSSQYSMVDVRDYLAFLGQHPELHERIRPLGTYYAVADVNKAFEDAEAGRNIKTLLSK